MLTLITRLKHRQLDYLPHQDHLIQALKDFNTSIDDVNLKDRIAIQIQHSIMVARRGEKLSSDTEMGFSLNSILYGSDNVLIARKLGSIYHALGFINSAEITILRRNDLVDSYCGWSSVKTNKILERHRNTLILIEEAHTLMIDENDMCGYEVLHNLSRFLYSDDGTIVILSTNQKLSIFNCCPGLRRLFMWDFDCMLLDQGEMEIKEPDCE